MPRPPKKRIIDKLPPCDAFKPAGIPLSNLDEVNLSIDEFEAIRLKDYEGHNHEKCAEKMNVSRPTFHRILSSGHKKIADALTHGKGLRIEGGAFRLRDKHWCKSCGHLWEESKDADELICPNCESEEIIAAHHRGGRRRHRHRGGYRKGKQ